MTKLHQLLAIEKDVRSTTGRTITGNYQLLQKPALLQGMTRTYHKLNEDGEDLAGETALVQANARQVINDTREAFARLWDLEATKDYTNLEATADVIVDGNVVIANAPATYLLWLEKELNDLHTTVSKLPTLDPAENWEWSSERNCYVSSENVTNRSKKVPRVLVKAEATDKHPAQVDVWHEDVTVGQWHLTKFSGALPVTTVKDLTQRVVTLREAVKDARARANEVEVKQQKVANKMLDYVFEPLSAS